MNISRIVNTGLKATVTNLEILNSVFGQLSDGMWENSPGARRYWKFADVDQRCGEVVINVDDGFGSGWSRMTDVEVKQFLARKIKQIAYDELGGGDNWDRKSTTELSYLGSSRVPVIVGDAYFAYDTLAGRDTTKKVYASSNPSDPVYHARQQALAAKRAEIIAAQATLYKLQQELASL